MSADTSRGTLSGVSAYLLWGVLTAYWKLLDAFDAFELIGWRVVTAVVLLLTLVAAQGKVRAVWGALRNPAMLWRVSVAAVLLAVNWTLYVWAVVNEHVIETALGYFIAPLLTIVLGVGVLREKLRLNLKIAVVFALAGLAVLTVSYGRVPWVAISIATTWSVYGLLKKQVPLKPLESLTAEVVILAIPALAFVAVTWNRSDSIPSTANAIEMVFALLTGVITAAPLLLFAGASQRKIGRAHV